MQERRFRQWLLVAYLVGVTILAIQPFRSLLSPAFQGLLPYRGPDESHYLVRLQEGLLHPFGDPSNGIFSGTDAPWGVQSAFLERVVGMFFSWTGFSAPAVALIVSILVAPFVLVLVPLLARRFDGERHHALIAGIFYFFLFLGPLRRVVHQSWSLPLTISALLVLTAWWQDPTAKRAIVAGLLLGLLPAVYFWSFTFLWSTAFLLLLFLFIDRRLQTPSRRRTALILVLIALVVALPFFLRLLATLQHPLALEVAQRSSLVLAREFESVPRSALYTLFLGSFLLFLRGTKNTSNIVPLLCAVVALFFVLHQQFLHGRVLSFWTHYYPYVCLIALMSVLVLLRNPPSQYQSCGRYRTQWDVFKVSALSIASLFLLAAFGDYQRRWTVFLPLDGSAFVYQHLSPVLEDLRGAPRNTILTDRETALVVASETDDDVVFTEHLRHVLIPTREYAERFCLSEVFGDPNPRWVPDVLHELSNTGWNERAQLYKERLRIAEEACVWVREHLREALQRFGVTRVLWNEQARPAWEIPSTPFSLEQEGQGWSLWRVAPSLNGVSAR